MKPIVLRKYRMILVTAMLILLPASGVLWAVTDSNALLALSILLSSLSVIAVLAEEAVCAAIDDEVARLETEVAQHRETIRSRDEALREESRILAMLEEQNSRLSADLMSKAIHSDAA